ncbi:long-subunit fatty acid transport protein [Lutibacter sp. Hel_I_33_5]|uniref:OmpP1/FadL family transporter n=1 Tax=Lutibacter sp. Hel_I_33_5 TaxID=1566289 RepID=UPI00119FC03A|nr:outer membrane protein transport protein [Lutibacter sp. Hel_I_33_5]TVZ56736.1 long-subunit fatty acid transport protein [Lutibacter sp. Hel_I_33_5]
MKKIILLATLFATIYTSYSQSLGYQDLALLFSENDNNGSARFTAMSGAFGSLGGDISSININPAGLSVFKNSQFSGTLNTRNTDINSSYYGNSILNQDDFFNISHAGAVLVFDSHHNSEWSKFAIGFNYRTKKDFKNQFLVKGNSGVVTFKEFPLDPATNPIQYSNAVQQQFSNTYSGDLSEFSMGFSAVHQNKLHIGAALHTYDLNFAQLAELRESNNDGNGNTLDARFYQENFTTGTGFSLNTGFIYKAHKSFRFGASYQTPTWYTEVIEETNITDNDGFNGDAEIAVSNNNTIYDNTTGNNFPTQGLLYKLKTPSKLTASAAFIFGKSGLLSFDYTNKHFKSIKLTNSDFTSENQFFQNDLRNTHQFNVGTEWRLDRFSIRGGYSFEQSPYNNAIDTDNIEGYSLGGGYNFGNLKLDLAYSDSSQTSVYNFYSGFNVNPANLNINNRRVTATLTLNL